MDKHLVSLEVANSRIVRFQASGAAGDELESLRADRDRCSSTLTTSYEFLNAYPERLAFLRVLLRNMDFHERMHSLSVLKATDQLLGSDTLRTAFENIGSALLERITPSPSLPSL